MRIEQFIYLIEISNSPSITVASEKLHISYQALSHSIKTLEEELNLTLLRRTNKGAVLTEEGEKIVSLAKQFIKGIELVQTEQANDIAQIQGTIKFITTSTCFENFFFDLMDYSKNIYPQIDFDYEIMHNSVDIYNRLAEEEDCFYVSFFGLECYDNLLPFGLKKIDIYQSEVKCACSKMHELTTYQSISFSQLKKQRLLLRSEDVAKIISKEMFAEVAFEKNPLLFEKKIHTQNYFTFVNSVPFAPYLIPEIKNTAIINLRTNYKSTLSVVSSENFKIDAKTQAFFEILCRKFNVTGNLKF